METFFLSLSCLNWHIWLSPPKPINCELGCNCQSSTNWLQHARWQQHPLEYKYIIFTVYIRVVGRSDWLWSVSVFSRRVTHLILVKTVHFNLKREETKTETGMSRISNLINAQVLKSWFIVYFISDLQIRFLINLRKTILLGSFFWTVANCDVNVITPYWINSNYLNAPTSSCRLLVSKLNYDAQK